MAVEPDRRAAEGGTEMIIEGYMLPKRGDGRALAEHLMNKAISWFEDPEHMKEYEQWHEHMEEHIQEYKRKWEQRRKAAEV